MGPRLATTVVALGATVAAGAAPRAALAGGVFGVVEAGAHRVTPLPSILGKVLDGHETVLTLAAGGGVGLGSRASVALDARYLRLEPQNVFQATRFFGRSPGSVTVVPLLATLGARLPVGGAFQAVLSAGAGAAYERQRYAPDPRAWNRSHVRACARLAAGLDRRWGSTALGVRAGWLFLPAVRIPQFDQADFGGLSLTAALSFGLR